MQTVVCLASPHLERKKTDMASNEDILGIDEVPKEITVESLRINYKYLKNEMESQELIDHLHKYMGFSDDFLERCKDTSVRTRRNDLVIKEIYYIALTKDSKVLHQFTSGLIQTGQSHIIDTLKNNSWVQGGLDQNSVTVPKLKMFFKEVKQNDGIEPKDFIDDLVERNAISFHDHEDVTRMEQRKKRVKFILNLVKPSFKHSGTIIKTVEEAYPKLFGVAEGIDLSIVKQSGGEAVNIKLNLKSHGLDKELRRIEKRSVENFERKRRENFKRKRRENNVMINDLEECITMFQRLRISSIIIELLTQDKNSVDKIVAMIQKGKAIDWLFSIIEERDKRLLFCGTKLQLKVLVTVNNKGNLNSFIKRKECICQLNQRKIQDNKDAVAKMITDISTLLKRLSSYSDSPQSILAKIHNSESLLDCLITEKVPRTWYCLLEEHIKKQSSVVENLFGEMAENTELNRSDIEQHEEYLKNELELSTFLPIIRSRNDTKSDIFLKLINKCSSRKARMSEFFAFILCEEDLGWFWELVRNKHPFVWETMTTSRRSSECKEQCEKDLLAFKLMNDTVVEEIDPFRLKEYLKDQTISDLGFDDFEDIHDKKSRAQYIVNRLSANTIGEFMIALRQGGFEYIYRQIKAGSLAKQYNCPRIHRIKQETIFKGLFDLPTGTCSREVPEIRAMPNEAVQTGFNQMFQPSAAGLRSQASVVYLEDLEDLEERRSISESEDVTYEIIANAHDSCVEKASLSTLGSPKEASLFTLGSPQEASLFTLGSPQEASLSTLGSPKEASLSTLGLPQEASLSTLGSPQEASLSTLGSPQEDSLSTVGSPKEASLSTLGSPQEASLSTLGSPKEASLSTLGSPKEASLSTMGSPQEASLSTLGSPQEASLSKLGSPQEISPDLTVSKDTGTSFPEKFTLSENKDGPLLSYSGLGRYKHNSKEDFTVSKDTGTSIREKSTLSEMEDEPIPLQSRRRRCKHKPKKVSKDTGTSIREKSTLSENGDEPIPLPSRRRRCKHKSKEATGTSIREKSTLSENEDEPIPSTFDVCGRRRFKLKSKEVSKATGTSIREKSTLSENEDEPIPSPFIPSPFGVCAWSGVCACRRFKLKSKEDVAFAVNKKRPGFNNVPDFQGMKPRSTIYPGWFPSPSKNMIETNENTSKDRRRKEVLLYNRRRKVNNDGSDKISVKYSDLKSRLWTVHEESPISSLSNDVVTEFAC